MALIPGVISSIFFEKHISKNFYLAWNRNHDTPKFRDLDEEFQTILVSRRVNGATATSGSAMGTFHSAVAEGDKKAAANALRDIKKSLDQDKQSGLVGRLDKEANYLHKE